MIHHPQNPSDETPQVKVEVGDITMEFWMAAGTPCSLEDLEAMLAHLPEGVHGWRAYATQGTRDTKWQGSSFSQGISSPRGCNFTLTVAGDGCDVAEFDRAYAVFSGEVRQVATQDH